MMPVTLDVYAHSLTGRCETEWEPLRTHLDATARLAGHNAAAFGWERTGNALGRLHDIGKVSRAFQAYIRMATSTDKPASGGDHSTAGARIAAERYHLFGRLLAYAIAGHHAGLGDSESLDRRLDGGVTIIPPFTGWEDHAGPLPTLAELKPTEPWQKNPHHRGFSDAFLTRMLFSCLVDADFLCTEAFHAAAEGTDPTRGGHLTVAALLVRLREHQSRQAVAASDLNGLRSAIRTHAVAQANRPPGLFTLTVPTGGGKTLTSLSFALEHAARHGLRRLVYVIPYTSIIEQTASIFREVLGTETDVLEHHASFDWEAAGHDRAGSEGMQGRDGLAGLRRAAENWDVPVVVTTAVQFFESLHAARTSRCRKLHNLARSVIVLDEAQSLPLHLLRPCLAAVDELRLNYGASIVLCTATQPAVRRALDEFKGGLDLLPERELAPDPPALYARLRRQRIERLPGLTDDDTIAARFVDQPQLLCIVNSRRHAWTLFDLIRDQPGAVHLSTYMCPRHRGVSLATIKRRLRAGEPVRLVSTSLVEAGVDFSFPEVWRAAAGLDSIAQAAGRCNREGELSPGLGRVVVFTPEGHAPPMGMTLPVQCAEGVLSRFADPLAPDAMRAYFRDLYWNRGPDAFDAAKLDGRPFPILRDMAETARGNKFNFDRIARAFRMIDDAAEPVVVPWQAAPDDREVSLLLERIEASNKPGVADLRALQRYTVPVPSNIRRKWLAMGAIRPVHRALGDGLLMLGDLSLYDDETGLRVFDGTPEPPAPTSSDDQGSWPGHCRRPIEIYIPRKP